MGLKGDLEAEVNSTFKTDWAVQKTASVPEPESLRLNSNHAKDLESATVLYADLDGSTDMVENFKWWFSAKVYKTYLRCAGQIIKKEGGVVTGYDGDRVMAVFTGASKNTSAVRCAMKISWAVDEIIKPALKAQYPTTEFNLKHVVGIDTSQLRTARIGVHGDNDLVWIGRAANYAAKLTTLSEKPIWITQSVYDRTDKSAKYVDGTHMWSKHCWNDMDKMSIYATTFRWPIS